ncbi:MAG: hypothetical protein PHY64_02970 [Eubacteriales bacterium]|nr:hypothetical protein [Eubacteriales bacterium]
MKIPETVVTGRVPHSPKEGRRLGAASRLPQGEVCAILGSFGAFCGFQPFSEPGNTMPVRRLKAGVARIAGYGEERAGNRISHSYPNLKTQLINGRMVDKQ